MMMMMMMMMMMRTLVSELPHVPIFYFSFSLCLGSHVSHV